MTHECKDCGQNHIEERDEAVSEERKRCADILRAAREGDIDDDLRSLIHRIESGKVVIIEADEEQS